MKALGVPSSAIFDQLGMFRAALGFRGAFSPMEENVPLGMEWLAHIILKEVHQHGALSDSKTQARVFIFILISLIQFWGEGACKDTY